MSRNLVLPYFSLAPETYNKTYFDEITRSFSVYLQQSQNPGEGRNTNIVLTDLPTDDVGLEIGALFQQGGFVKVTLADRPHARGSLGTGVVGDVTVTTS
tara:strand:+ start:2654 stop:2950 length:297 start_codon:yes stop_codon:yes gene_type:complete